MPKKKLHRCKRNQRRFFVLQGYYNKHTGWEDLTAEDTSAEIKKRAREYRENEGGRYRIVRKKCV